MPPWKQPEHLFRILRSVVEAFVGFGQHSSQRTNGCCRAGRRGLAGPSPETAGKSGGESAVGGLSMPHPGINVDIYDPMVHYQ
jgi:hypothetical protein